MAADETEILFLGTSSLFYAEKDEKTLPQLIEEALGRAAPDSSWRCRAEWLYLGERMPERAVFHIRDKRPDVVVLFVDGSQCVDDGVVNAIRLRWPRLYGPQRWFSERLKHFSGGGDARKASWLFNLPRAIGARIFGTAPLMPLDEGIRHAKEMLSAVVREEYDGLLICTLPGAWEEWQRPRLERFAEELGAHCREHHVVSFDVNAGVAWGRAIDNLHADFSTRQARSVHYADFILKCLSAR